MEPEHTQPNPCANLGVSQPSARRKSVFVIHPTNRMSVVQGLFLGGSRCRAVVKTHLVAPKMPWAPSAFPKKGVPGDKRNPSKEGYSLGGWPPEA